ncbi:arginine--tRNA ligase [Alkalisalibacterium limincola]|uniref:arginine--tRNA ligase domain-containing protein n=1 Tax=Alkalisalibacterium limincola TaxID=2699169 RepID=UPI0021065077|nr:arginine--tRNA ligase [Alkalisalibacterium limincola]
MKELLRELVAQALLDLKRDGFMPAELTPPDFTIERTRSREHGDYAANIALLLAKPVGRKPREIAEAIVSKLLKSQSVDKVDIAGPGFINFHLSQGCRLGTLRRVLELKSDYGREPEASRDSVTVEFVSANPTGPLHVGHGRGAAYGASLANVLEAYGHTVQREYYVNDAGRQMDILGTSVWLRYLELCGESLRFPDNGYRGEYVYEIARALRSEHGDRLRHAGRDVMADLPADAADGGDKEVHIDALTGRAKRLLGDDYRLAFGAGLDSILADIREDLGEFGVHFDSWFSEAR